MTIRARQIPLALLLLLTALSLNAAPKKTNFIVIMTDDLGYADLGCYGNDRIETPHIDAMAKAGIRFTDYHSNSSASSPSRAALLTGRYPYRSGLLGDLLNPKHLDVGLPLSELTFAEVLKESGYRTALFGKWHLGHKVRYNPIFQGFDRFTGFVGSNTDYHSHINFYGENDWWKQDKQIKERGYTTDLITDHAINFIKESKDKPFLIYIAHAAPHFPYQGRNDPVRYTNEKIRRHDPANYHAYREMIQALDDNIGRIIDTISEENLDDTLIIFASTNGPNNIGSAGPLKGKKNQIWEGGHRVPAIIYWPKRIKVGRVSDQTIMAMDIFPTLIAAAGAELPKDHIIDGSNLLPYLIRHKTIGPRVLFWRHRNALALRLGKFKLVADSTFTQVNLYDLNKDIGETKDISEDKPKHTKELSSFLKYWYEDAKKVKDIRTPSK